MTEPDVQAALQTIGFFLDQFVDKPADDAMAPEMHALDRIKAAIAALRDERDALLRENAVHRASYDALGAILGRENWSGGVGGWSVGDVERVLAGLRADTEKLRAFWLDLWEIFSDGEGGDIDQEAFLAACESAGLVVQVAYDPDKHGELAWGDSEPGEMIYMPATPPAGDGGAE